MTCTVYNDLDNVTLKGVQFRTYDNAKKETINVAEDGSAKFSVKSLPNGPYTLAVWFDYTLKNGTVKTLNSWTPVYVSNGNAYFARAVYKADDATMKTWLATQRNDLAADDLFQAWMAKHGGDNLEAALRTDNITYPYYSNTERYPNNTPKWKALAHEICPDEDASDFTKVRLLHDWMAANLVYDKRVVRDGLPYRWAENGSGEFSLWNTHLGVCYDFSNAYAIMCRELGVPCRIITDTARNHGYNAVYLNGRWELVDLVISCESTYVENSQEAIDAFWAKRKTPSTVNLAGFLVMPKTQFEIHSYETDKYTKVEQKINGLDPLDRDLATKRVLQASPSIYNH